MSGNVIVLRLTSYALCAYAILKSVKRPVWLILVLVPLLTFFQGHNSESVLAQGTIAPSIFIQSPREGQALQGIEIIDGRIRGEGFLQGKVSFSTSGVDEPTWFFISDILPEGEAGSQISFQIEWDTTSITDGNYNLRIVAEYQDQAAIYALVPNLRIRNYSAVETSTPIPSDSEGTIDSELSPTPEPTLQNTPTLLPENPLIVEQEDLSRTLRISLIAVVVLFIVGGAYWMIKNRSSR